MAAITLRMRIVAAAALFALCAAPALADEPCPSRPKCAAVAVEHEVFRYAKDTRSLVTAPLHWDAHAWERFAEGSAVVLTLYSQDRPLYDRVQANRSSFTDSFAKRVTPFGGGRGMQLSVVLIVAGIGLHDDALRDAGRDALEADILAGGLVTPAIKHIAGRARPIQNEGSHSFHPFNAHFESFPSGHATSAFSIATAVAAHYDGWVVPSIAYTLASGVAFSRVNDRAHFFSDVAAGAMIGHAVARSLVARHAGAGGTRRAWMMLPIVGAGKVGLLVRVTGR